MLVLARRLWLLGLACVVLAGCLLGWSGSAFAASGFGLMSAPAVVPLLVPTEPPAEPTTGPVGPVTGTTAVLEGALNVGAGGTSGYYFAYNQGESCEGGPTTAPGEASAGPVHAEVGELRPATRYTFCLVATNEFGSTAGSGVGFETLSAPPTVGEVSASEVDSMSVTLGAQVDANGAATSYRVEYGLSEAYESSTPEYAIGMSAGPAGVQAHLHGLTPDTEYHYRFVVSSALGSEHTADATFTTAAVGAAAVGLPDGRVYEKVSSADDEEAEIYTPLSFEEGEQYGDGIWTTRLFQVAVDGNAVAYQGDVAPSSGGEGNGGPALGSQYLARRSAGGGWTQVSIQPSGYRGAIYEALSSDLSTGILQSSGRNGEGVSYGGVLSPEAPAGEYEVLYSRALGEDVYRPLFTKTPPNRPNSGFGAAGVRLSPVESLGRLAFAGASADSSQSLFEADDALIAGGGVLESELQEDARNEAQEGKQGNYLYDSADGRLSLVDVLPDGRVEPNATFGAPPIGAPSGPAPDFNHVISSDGSRVYWTALNTGVVYVRVNGASTIPVSVGPARFWTATGDGRYAFYTEGEELYRFDVEHPQAREVLTDVGAGVEGVVGVSENGEDVYFVASGALAPGATAGRPNLYLTRDGGSPVITFIATLSPEDGTGEIEPYYPGFPYNHPVIGDWTPSAGYRTAQVTADAGSLVFMSNRPLKAQGFPAGYDNRGQEEVYVYDAATGQLSCASCARSGIPGSTGYLPIAWSPTYVPQWISQDGSRVFFDTPSGLVPQDINGKQDVYEWEREGSGNCHEGTYGGCIYLLSGGVSSSASWLLGSSADGSDVFMITRAQLTPEDDNELFDVYDARVGGVPPVAPVVCSGASCRGVPASAPGFATPPSVAYGGAGNISPLPSPQVVKVGAKRVTRAQQLAVALKVCRKRSGHARAVCEAGVRRRYGPVRKAKKKASRSAMRGRR